MLAATRIEREPFTVPPARAGGQVHAGGEATRAGRTRARPLVGRGARLSGRACRSPARVRSPLAWPPESAVFLVTLVLALLALEGALRWAILGTLRAPEYGHTVQMFDPHPTRGWKLKSGIRAYLRTPDYSVLHATNSRGYRDVEHELEKPPGVYRVVVLGDSFMEAGQVALEESFARVLEDELDGARRGRSRSSTWAARATGRCRSCSRCARRAWPTTPTSCCWPCSSTTTCATTIRSSSRRWAGSPTAPSRASARRASSRSSPRAAPRATWT